MLHDRCTGCAMQIISCQHGSDGKAETCCRGACLGVDFDAIYLGRPIAQVKPAGIQQLSHTLAAGDLHEGTCSMTLNGSTSLATSGAAGWSCAQLGVSGYQHYPLAELAELDGRCNRPKLRIAAAITCSVNMKASQGNKSKPRPADEGSH